MPNIAEATISDPCYILCMCGPGEIRNKSHPKVFVKICVLKKRLMEKVGREGAS